jgi:hypothetical protein
MLSRGVAGLFVLALLAMLGGSAVAESGNAGSADKQSDGAFTGLAMLTDDPEWYTQFQRPETPQINGRDHFDAGELGVLAILFSNAEPRDGVVKVMCDITSFDPDGSQLVVDSGPCYEGPYNGPNILHPALLTLNFRIGPDEPAGRAGFEITLRDAYSGRAVDLAVAFTQGTIQ